VQPGMAVPSVSGAGALMETVFCHKSEVLMADFQGKIGYYLGLLLCVLLL